METLIQTDRQSDNGKFDIERYLLSDMHQDLLGKLKPETNGIREKYIDTAYSVILSNLKSEDPLTRANGEENLRKLCSIATNRT